MKILSDNSRQSILDVALREFGSVSAAFEISSQCNVSITSDLTQELKVSAIESDDVVVAYYQNKGFNPATKFHESDVVDSDIADSENAITLIKPTQKRTITPLDRQAMFDVAIQHFGNMEATFDLSETNNISITSDLTQELKVSAIESDDVVVAYYQNKGFNPATKFHESDVVDSDIADSENAITLIKPTQKRTITPLDRQTMLDVAIQHFGNMEATFDLSETNNVSITSDLTQELDIPTASLNKRVLSYYTNRNIKPATALQHDNNTTITNIARYFLINYCNENWIEIKNYEI